MCAHAEHETVERSDGSVAETHVLTADDMERLQLAVQRMVWRVGVASYAHGWPKDGTLPLSDGGV
ncbi:hypothetical protein GCM10010353_47830 [Streptomyces chryseus]|nr:hypothetical protein GCM10010353_47830 [Streptomyces chryseus]